MQLLDMSSSQKELKSRKKTALFLLWTGVIFIAVSTVLFFLIFGQVVKEEVKYDLHAVTRKGQPEAVITPVNDAFGIIIPRIGANAPIIQNVDPFNEEEYQVALSKGIAHAKGSALPEHTNKGSVFLFAHSAANFYEANRYNAVFYLLNKLEKKDPIYVFYNEKKYTYFVTETKIVNEDQVELLSGRSNQEQLILMTCWPAGTSFKRFLVFAKP